MILSRPCPSTASSTRAIRTDGNESCRSAMRMISASSHPPNHAAAAPSVMPMARAHSVVTTLCALAIGITLGAAAAWFGGWLDALIMRIADLQLSFPSVLIALVLLAVLGQGLDKIIVALVAVQWAYYARTAPAAALVERRKEYIDAAVALALSNALIIFRHLLPNCLPPLLVLATVQVAAAITLEATLSFLGLGLPITEPSLGLLIANGYQYLLSGKYWISFFPGVALLLTIVSINLVADQLRDVLNPRLQR